jgi:hypothetical protein
MNKVKTFSLALALSFILHTAVAQTVDEVVNKNIEALGGKEKLASIKTIHMEGSMNVMGNEVSLNVSKSHLAGMRMDISVAGMTGYQINTPAQGWEFMPFQGQTAPQAWPEDRVKSGVGNLDIQGIFMEYKTKGTTLELQGKETVEGAECYKIKATLKNGNVTTYFVDTKTNFVVKTSGIRKIQGEDKEIESIFSNFQKTKDGFMFPFTVGTPNGEVTYTKIEVNTPIDEKIFSPN